MDEDHGDLYLRFPDKQSADDVLQDYTGSIDIIGEIDGATGWHVNVRGPLTLELEAFAVEVATPVRVWA